MAEPARPLEDAELGTISGQGGVSFAVDLFMNQVYQGGSKAQSYMSLGFKDTDGQSNYLVFDRPHGVLGIYGMTLDIRNRTDGGGSYCEIGLPPVVTFKDAGFDSVSAQASPTMQQMPFDQTLGSLSVNGRLSMTGQIRVWSN